MRVSLARKLIPGLSLTVMLALLLTAGVSLLSSHATQAAGWNMIWHDEFDGTGGSGLNRADWLYDIGTSYPGGAGQWGTGEVEYATDSTANVYQDGSGHLAIKPIRDGNGNWTSGRIETQRTDFAAPAGGKMAVEASIQQPNVSGAAAAGYWPAFWMLGAPFRGVYNNWPSIGEIDILEDINGLSSVFGTLHCGNYPQAGVPNPCNETTGLGSGQRACSGCQTAYHTYRVEYDRTVSPEQMRWYLDGANYFTVNANQVDATTWNNAVHHGFFVIFDLALGGGFPAAFGAGAPTASTQSGVPMLVDYVRVYTDNGSGSNPTPTPVPNPTATPTPSSGCGGSFTQGVVSTGASSAQPWFKLCSGTAQYVILHYTLPGQTQQNINASYNSGTGRWEYNVTGIGSGQTLQYSFTYNVGGNQYDTPGYSWSSSGAPPTPTPTPTPVTCTGSYSVGVNSTGGSSAQPWFKLCNGTASYVIIHYTLPGQSQQNVNASYNSGTGRWEYNVNGIGAGQTIQYSFTYNTGGLQYDTSGNSWTHP